jgi:hypothetical protein
MKGTIGRLTVAIASIVSLTGCVMHSTTPELVDGSSTATIYRVSEREAFLAVLEALAEELPSQSVDDDWVGETRGYGATSRFGMDTTEYTILVLPVTGQGSDGQAVNGYRYQLKSSGTRLIEAPLRHKRIRELIHSKLAARAVSISDARPGTYETDGKAYLGRKRDARDVLKALSQ